MQLACIFNNLEAQKWQNLDKIFIETQTNLPDFFACERQNAWIKSKSARFQPAARQNLAGEGQKFNSIREEKSGILKTLA